MNRQQRRAAERKQPAILRGKTLEEKKAMLCKHGITPEMLEAEYKAGFQAGRDNGVRGTFMTIYAAIMLAANQEYGFGKERALRLLKAVDNIVITSLHSDETIDAVWEKFGIALSFDAGVDRIDSKEAAV